MRKIKNFIPLEQSKKIVFIKNFINDFIDALIGFFIGAAIEAIFDLEFIKAAIFIFFYIIFSIFFRKNNQKVGHDKNNFKLRCRGIKEIKKLLLLNLCFEAACCFATFATGAWAFPSKSVIPKRKSALSK